MFRSPVAVWIVFSENVTARRKYPEVFTGQHVCIAQPKFSALTRMADEGPGHSLPSKNCIRDQKATQFRSLYRGDCPHFPCSICSRIYRRGGTIGEGYETVNYGSRAHLAFCVPSVCRRAFGIRTRHGLLAWRRFRRECSLERRTAE